MPTKKELYEIYKRLGGNKPLEELKNSQWTMLSGIYYVEEAKDRDKLFKGLRNVLDMVAEFSGIIVSDKAIEKALGGNGAMCEALLSIINERIEWWKECDINKALYAKEIYDKLESFYDKEWDDD